jgi:hypothetical protein
MPLGVDRDADTLAMGDIWEHKENKPMTIRITADLDPKLIERVSELEARWGKAKTQLAYYDEGEQGISIRDDEPRYRLLVERAYADIGRQVLAQLYSQEPTHAV